MFHKNAKVLLFHVEKTKQKQIIDLCRKLQIESIIVPKRQYGESLGALAGISGIPRKNTGYEGAELSKEMLVFSGIASEELDVFLEQYRVSGIAPVDLKAVVTPNNVFWNVPALYEELFREHNSLKQSEDNR